jgi:hypothetical protein
MTEFDRASGDSERPRSPEAAGLVVVSAELRTTYPLSELLGREVINDREETIGEVDDLMMTYDRVAFVVLSVGGFLGIGAHRVVVPLDRLFVDEEEMILPGATKQTLKGMTAYHPEQARAERVPLRKARKGVKDAGEVVTTAFDQPIAGVIPDITDGDF